MNGVPSHAHDIGKVIVEVVVVMLSGPASFVFLSFLMTASVSATVNWLGMLWLV